MFSSNVVFQTGHQPVMQRAAQRVLQRVMRAIMWATLLVASATASNALSASNAAAQVPKINLQGPRTLVGIVVDSAGAPIVGAEVSLPSLGWITRSRANGAFRFDSIKVKAVEVRVRALGWIVPNETVVIGPTGGSIIVRMTRVTQLMPDVVTKAVRGGLRGVVVDSTLRPIPNVKVQAIGGQSDTVTDVNGAYYFPLKAGHYMLRMDRDGYERQMVGATISDSMAANVVTIMYGRVGKPNIIEGASLTSLGDRMIRNPPSSTKYFSREDLDSLRTLDLAPFLRRWAVGPVTNGCKVTLGATMGLASKPITIPIDQLSIADLEFVELYLPTIVGMVRPTYSLGSKEAPTAGKIKDAQVQAGGEGCGSLGLIVWLRK